MASQLISKQNKPKQVIFTYNKAWKGYSWSAFKRRLEIEMEDKKKC